MFLKKCREERLATLRCSSIPLFPSLCAWPYKGITFTMPDLLWSFFRDNRFLVPALSALAANAILISAAARQGLQVGIITFPQTFNGWLEFNPHVHTRLARYAAGWTCTEGRYAVWTYQGGSD